MYNWKPNNLADNAKFHNAGSGKHIPSEIDSLEIIRLIPERKQGSADIVTEDRMNKGLVINSLNALSGQAAGVNVTSGEKPNGTVEQCVMRVRGTTSLTGGNDPLVIIDGVYSDLSTLSSIYPADIESFTILKNAAETAKYGSRGASGAIQVTTKKGHGSMFHISYDGNIGFESKYKTIDMLQRNGYIYQQQRHWDLITMTVDTTLIFRMR